ncbi:MAG: glycoside hydrolase family 13 protein [Kineosporiaceae bacterium]
MTDALHADAADAPQGLTPLTEGWWRDAVIYQVYPRSFADGDGDGVGDLPGITARLDHIAKLGVDAVWLSPFYTSPQNDAGYDVADYRDVDPLFGTLADADALIERAHELGLKIIVDLVPNHTSSAHPWFAAALAAAPGSPERERYMFREGKGADGELPPNDWRSVFGGPAWTRVTEPDGSPGQWYLHLFDVTQPDVNWDNPEVRAEFEDILRFWSARGVDGFRVDVANGLVKEPGLPDWPFGAQQFDADDVGGRRPPMWDQEGVHEIFQSWRRVLDAFPQQPILVAEAWVRPAWRQAKYVRADEMHQAFNFEYLKTPWDASRLRPIITEVLAENAAVGASATWVLSNHDVVRHPTRYSYGAAAEVFAAGAVAGAVPNGIGANDPQPDQELSRRRGLAATLLMLALPGSSYLYQGEELGLPEHTTLPDEVRQDPTWERSGHAERGRDGCRVPLPWVADAPGFGFGPADGKQPWLPQPESWADLAADAQDGVEGSVLERYREALRLRRRLGLGRGSLSWRDDLCVEGPRGAGALAFEVEAPDGTRTLVIATVGDGDGSPTATLPSGAQVLLSSGELQDGHVPTDVTVWARLA